LTSGLFRKEFYNTLWCCSRGHGGRVGAVTQMIGTQTLTAKTQIGLTRMKEKRNQQDCSIEIVQ